MRVTELYIENGKVKRVLDREMRIFAYYSHIDDLGFMERVNSYSFKFKNRFLDIDRAYIRGNGYLVFLIDLHKNVQINEGDEIQVIKEKSEGRVRIIDEDLGVIEVGENNQF